LQEVRHGENSNLLQPFPTGVFLTRLASSFRGARLDANGLLHWTDELDNGFVARAYPQHVEVCLFDVADDDFDRVFEIADEFGANHYDWGN
jgi:hypothetical protein